MSQFSKTDQKRITLLSLISSASNLADGIGQAYNDALDLLETMEKDGFFEEERASARPTQQRSERSARPASRGQSSNSSDRRPFSGNYRNPDAPATEKQIAAILKMTDDYTEAELEEFTISEAGQIISDLKG